MPLIPATAASTSSEAPASFRGCRKRLGASSCSFFPQPRLWGPPQPPPATRHTLEEVLPTRHGRRARGGPEAQALLCDAPHPDILLVLDQFHGNAFEILIKLDGRPGEPERTATAHPPGVGGRLFWPQSVEPPAEEVVVDLVIPFRLDGDKVQTGTPRRFPGDGAWPAGGPHLLLVAPLDGQALPAGGNADDLDFAAGVPLDWSLPAKLADRYSRLHEWDEYRPCLTGLRIGP